MSGSVLAAQEQSASNAAESTAPTLKATWDSLGVYLSQGWDVWTPRLLYAAGVMAGAVALWVVARLVLRLAARQAKKTQTDWDDVIIESLQGVMGWAFLAGGAAYAVTFLQVPILVKVVHALVILVLAHPVSQIATRVINFLEKTVASKTETKADDILFEILGRFTGFAVYAIAVVMALDHVGINVTPFIAGAGVAGVAIGFAAKDTLSNLVAGILLLLDRPFERGDRIEVWSAPKNSATWGDVVDIGIRATKIRTTDNITIVIPNNEVMKRDIINYTAQGGGIRLRINVGIAYEADVVQAKELLIAIARELPWVIDDPRPPVVVVREFGQSSVNLQLRVWIADARKRIKTISHVTDRAHAEFKKAGVEIPYPKRDLYVHNVVEPVEQQVPSGKTDG